MSEPVKRGALEAVDLDGLDIEAAVVRLVEHAVNLPASDLFFASDEHDAKISVRHLGILKPLMAVTRDDGARYVNHVKAVAGLPLDQRFRPLDGRWVCRLKDDKQVDLRINTIPTLWGEDLAIRLLECDMGLLELKNLGFHQKNREDLSALLNDPAGLILVTGPAGAGKTTTLYACLNYLNDGTRKINTIEDPVEFAMVGIRQSEVRPKFDLDFPDLLRSVIRQSPDVIMIGEIRDPITADTAVLAANSGHLVFATLHAPIAAGAIDSMLGLGVNPHFLSSSLLGALSQRLVRRLCDDCKIAHDLTAAPETFAEIRRWLEPGQGDQIYSAHGCANCHYEGFDRRTGVAEVLRVTKEIRQAILERRSAREIRREAIQRGMLDLRRSALLKVAQGVTSTEEVVRTIPAEHLLPEN
ncbi:MAG: GspE/PulE family protein [Planctomycetota bacterium]|jgi:type II secretory ATPase GspE/PulE/Tfp pilus assembly ATPase PilB-like protein